MVNDKGRVITPFLQNDLGGSVFKLPVAIGKLTELEVLHVYGPEKHNHKKRYWPVRWAQSCVMIYKPIMCRKT